LAREQLANGADWINVYANHRSLVAKGTWSRSGPLRSRRSRRSWTRPTDRKKGRLQRPGTGVLRDEGRPGLQERETGAASEL